MGDVYLLYSNDITTEKVNNKISECLSESKKTVYLISNESLKTIRVEENKLLTKETCFTFGEFEKNIKTKVYKMGKHLSSLDQRYILSKIINNKFENSKKLAMFTSMQKDLMELFDLLLFNDIESVDTETIQVISEDYSDFEADIFLLYNEFSHTINDLLDINSKEIEDPKANEVKINRKNIKKGTMLIGQLIKNQIDSDMDKTNAVFFDGFITFNDIQRYMIQSAIKHNCNVYFISKLDFDKPEHSFIFDQNYKKIIELFGKETIMVPLGSPSNSQNSALGYLREVYPNTYTIPNSEITNRFDDQSIEIIKPFISREDEIEYVVTRISDYLRSLNTDDIDIIKDALKNDIAITLPRNWHAHYPIYKSILDRVGLFVLKNNLDPVFDIDFNGLSKIYYSKAEFLQENISKKNGDELDLQQKLLVFNNCYHKLRVKAIERTASSYPVSEYVKQIYKFATKGISVQGFKLVLYSNWFYLTRKSEVKWETYIEDFNRIECYLTQENDLNAWINIIDEIKILKSQIEQNNLYSRHPLISVKSASLDFFSKLLKEIKQLIEGISFTAPVSLHVSALIHDVMNAFEIIDDETDNLNHEQIIIKKIYETAKEIGKTSIVENIDIDFFASNLVGMIDNLEKEKFEEEKSEFAFAALHLDNMRKYKTVIYTMAENDVHPRTYSENFPYTKNIIEILTNEKYNLMCAPSSMYGLEYHILLQNFGFRNALDYATEKIIFTRVRSNNGKLILPSIYCRGAALAFDKSLSVVEIKGRTSGITEKFSHSIPNTYLGNKKSYSVFELAMFKMCQKRYYHDELSSSTSYISEFQLSFLFQAIVLVSTFDQFISETQKNRKVYSVYDNRVINDLFIILSEKILEHKKYFDFLPNHVVKDAEKSLQKTVATFATYELINSNRTGHFAILPPEILKYELKGNSVLAEYDMRVYHGKTYNNKLKKHVRVLRPIQYSTLIDTLVQGTGSYNGEFIWHYAQIVEALDSEDIKQDRIALIYRMIDKINAQFDSENERFNQDGAARCEQLVNEIESCNFTYARASSTKYCHYCIYSESCKYQYQDDNHVKTSNMVVRERPEVSRDTRVELTQKQMEIVTDDSYPLHLGAGAGTGKTAVLVKKIIHLFSKKQVDVTEIIVVTFTNKAVDEIAVRLHTQLYDEWVNTARKGDDERALRLRRLVETSASIHISTIHALCESLLREFGMYIGLPINYSVQSFRAETNDIIDRTIENNITIQNDTHHSVKRLVKKIIDYCFSHGIELGDKYLECIDESELNKKLVTKICVESYQAIENAKKEKHILTLDDTKKYVNRLLEDDYVAKIVAGRYKYAFFDEFQDTDKEQFKIAKKLVQSGVNVFLVGDDKQSIYAFRGADIESAKNAAEFVKSLNNKSFYLDENFRSAPQIIDYVNSVFSQNFAFENKKLDFPFGKLRSPETNISTENNSVVFEFQLNIADTIKNLVDYSYDDITVLCRYNSHVKTIEKELREVGIPVVIVGGRNFYGRKEIIDTYKILSALLNFEDSIQNEIIFTDYYQSIMSSKKEKVDFNVFLEEMKYFIREETINSIFTFLFEKSRILDYYKSRGYYQSIANLSKLKKIAFDFSADSNSHLIEFLSYLDIRIKTQPEEDEAAVDESFKQYGAVTIMTIHAAKGLSLPVVILPNLDRNLLGDHVIPEFIIDDKANSLALVDDDEYKKMLKSYLKKYLEEELRIFYVAMTRAKEKLILGTRMDKNQIDRVQAKKDYYSFIGEFAHDK